MLNFWRKADTLQLFATHPPVTDYSDPCEDNWYLADHIQLLRTSFHQLTGRNLIDPNLSERDAAKSLYFAPCVLVSHNTAADPIFNYGNRTALDLFELSWTDFTTLPSRKSAEIPDQAARSQLLQEVATKGYIDHYAGIRIASSGRRFQIDGAVVWNLRDQQGVYRGQAATFSTWKYL
jgi:hypothetical protein